MRPAFQIEANGIDITELIRDRLVSLSITDEAGITADALEVTLDDRDFQLELPPTGATLHVWLGYEGQPLQDMGTYSIDEVELSGLPAQLVFRGRSADMVASLKTWKKRSWDKTLNPSGTLGAILETIAAEHGLQPAIAEEFVGVPVDHLDQTYESDMNLLTRLADQYGAVAKPAGGFLVFTRKGSGKDANGEPLPEVTLRPMEDEFCDWRASYHERAAYSRVGAHWNDKKGAAVRYVYAGNGDPTMYVRHPFKSERDATAAAQAKLRQLQRGRTGLSLTCLGRPTLCAEMPLEIVGTRGGVDGTWICTRALHSLDGSGLRTSLEAQRSSDFEHDSRL